MKTNDSLRRLRYILDLNDKRMIAVFAQAEQVVTREQVSAWLKKDDDEAFEECTDSMFATFLNGLINERRGKQDGPQAPPESRLNNNLVFRKLKIAFNLQADEILQMLVAEGRAISKHELSAFFRRPDHKHYRECKDQVLRNFLAALQLRHRGPANDAPEKPENLPSPVSDEAATNSIWPKR